MSSVHDYDYALPQELIAQQPLACRSDARLLVLDRARETTTHAHVRELAHWIAPADALVVNETRVVPARLVGHRVPTGGRFEGLFLAALDDGRWRLLAKTRGRLQPGDAVALEDAAGQTQMQLALQEQGDGGVWTAQPSVQEAAWSILERVGRVPLPCYIRAGQAASADLERYQTVYARVPGSAAAPTAGLHMTPELIEQLQAQGTLIERVTLHVGLDTFRPMQVERLEDHQMHSEWRQVADDTAQRLNARRAAGGRIMAVGTTTARTLESAVGPHGLQGCSGPTDLFIRPPYRFGGLDGLLTNFHLPRSTLLVMVSALAGREFILQAYRAAVQQGYRFYSYGDAMLIV